MWDRIGHILKDTVGLNLKFGSTLLHVSTDYLRDINKIVTTGAHPAPPPADKPGARVPLLIAGQSNETASAAFTLNNPSDKDVNVTLLVQGELSEQQVKIVPSSMALKSGENAVVRVLARMDESLEVNRDYGGAVVAPGLSSQSVEFVVRRLPGQAPPPETHDPTPSTGPKGQRRTPRRRPT